MTITLHQGDCREVLRTLPDGAFDACITDPPYGDTSLAWDRQVAGWIPEVARTLKPAASIWVLGSMRFLAPLFADMEAAGFRYAQDIVWEKQNGTGFHNDRFKRVHEHAVQFYRGPWSDVFKAPQFTAEATARTVRRKTRPTHTGHIERSSYTSIDGGPRLARSVIAAANMHGRAIHPTEKPAEILLPLIQYSVPLGGLVLDPFAGSGSLLRACRVVGVSAVGIELLPEHVAAARAALADDFPLFSEAA